MKIAIILAPCRKFEAFERFSISQTLLRQDMYTFCKKKRIYVKDIT